MSLHSLGVTPNLFGDYALETREPVIPGESRGPDGARLHRKDPGFRRGSRNCLKGIITNLFQSLPRT